MADAWHAPDKFLLQDDSDSGDQRSDRPTFAVIQAHRVITEAPNVSKARSLVSITENRNRLQNPPQKHSLPKQKME